MSENTNEKKPSLMAQLGAYLAEQWSQAGVNIDLVAEKVKAKLGLSEDWQLGGGGESDPELTVTPTTEIGGVATGTSQTLKHSEWLRKILTTIVPPSIRITDDKNGGASISSKTFVMGEAVSAGALSITATAYEGTSAVKYIKNGEEGTEETSGSVNVSYPPVAIDAGTSANTNVTYKFIAEGEDGGKSTVEFKVTWEFKYRTATSLKADETPNWGAEQTYASNKSFTLTAQPDSKVYVLVPTIKGEPTFTAQGMTAESTKEGSIEFHNLSYDIWSVKNEDLSESNPFVVKLK